MRTSRSTATLLLMISLPAALACCKADTAGSTKTCGACVASTDCEANEKCATLPGGGFCVAECSASGSCSGGLTCSSTKTSEGSTSQLCLASNGACSAEADGGGSGFDGGTSVSPFGDGGFSSTITASGGTESQLYFAIVGDTRPYTSDDAAHYPASPPLTPCTTSTDSYVGTDDNASCGAITKIFQDVQAMNPQPPLVISTGDYQYVTPGKGDSMTQLGYYQTARAIYSGMEWPAMGNHECDGYTASNCANGCPHGDQCTGSNTENFLSYQQLFLTPIGETLPYYARTVTAADGSWTAHFIFASPNYWNVTEQNWLTQQLTSAGPSSTHNYIFVIHHEDATAGSPESLSTIESIESGPETMSIVGHSHTWARGGQNPKELLVGNGGVPSSSARNLGYTTIVRLDNGQLQVTAYDFLSNDVIESYLVNP